MLLMGRFAIEEKLTIPFKIRIASSQRVARKKTQVTLTKAKVTSQAIGAGKGRLSLLQKR